MTTSLQTPSLASRVPESEVAEPAVATPRSAWRWLWILLVVLFAFAATYALAWFNANQLTTRFVRDADASFDAGNYLDALVGYEQFDEQTQTYINYGGYLAVEKIWSNRYSWPQPAAVAHALARSQEIIQQRLTLDAAEQYIQANIGKPAPYFGEIYLRLGELYEADGSVADARDIYASIPDLFASRPDLIEQAQAHLARLPDAGQ